MQTNDRDKGILAEYNTSQSRGIWLSLLPTILYAAVLPYLIYRVASAYMPQVPALLLAGIPPAFVTITGLLRRRHLNLLGTLSLTGIAVKLISALIFRDIHLILVSDSLMIGVYGLIMLVSVVVGKPILLVLARNMLSTASPTSEGQLEQRWGGAHSHTYFMAITAIWGTGLFMVLVVCAILAYTVSISRYLLVSPIVQYSVFGALLLGSQLFGIIRRYRKSHAAA